MKVEGTDNSIQRLAKIRNETFTHLSFQNMIK